MLERVEAEDRGQGGVGEMAVDPGLQRFQIEHRGQQPADLFLPSNSPSHLPPGIPGLEWADFVLLPNLDNCKITPPVLGGKNIISKAVQIHSYINFQNKYCLLYLYIYK